MSYTFQDTDEHFSDPTNCEQAEKAMRRYEKAVRLIYDLNKGRQEGRGFKVTDRDRDDRASALRALEAEIGEWAAGGDRWNLINDEVRDNLAPYFRLDV